MEKIEFDEGIRENDITLHAVTISSVSVYGFDIDEITEKENNEEYVNGSINVSFTEKTTRNLLYDGLSTEDLSLHKQWLSMILRNVKDEFENKTISIASKQKEDSRHAEAEDKEGGELEPKSD